MLLSSLSARVSMSSRTKRVTVLGVSGQSSQNLVSNIHYSNGKLCRNFDPTPAPCRISFDTGGHAIALTDLERSGTPSPTPTPMYAGVTANTPRVSTLPLFSSAMEL